MSITPMTPKRPGTGGLRRFDARRDLKALVSLMVDSLGDELDPASRVALDKMRRISQPGM